jgi:hypothetical protein
VPDAALLHGTGLSPRGLENMQAHRSRGRLLDGHDADPSFDKVLRKG